MNLIKLAASISLAAGLGLGAFSDVAVARSRTPTDGGRMNSFFEFDFFVVDETPEENPLPTKCEVNTCLFEGAIEDFRAFFDGTVSGDLLGDGSFRSSLIGDGVPPLSGVASTFSLRATKEPTNNRVLYEFENGGVSLYDEVLKGIPAGLLEDYKTKIGNNSSDPFIRFFWKAPADEDAAFMNISYIRDNLSQINGEDSGSAEGDYKFFDPMADVEDDPIQSVPEPTTTTGFLVLSMLGLGGIKRKSKLQ